MLGGSGESARVVEESREPRSVARVTDAVLDWSLVVLAAWTIAYHVGILAGFGSDVAVVATAAVSAAGAVWMYRDRRSRPRAAALADPLPGRPVDKRWGWATGAFATVAGLGMALSLTWWLVVAAWLGAAVAGTAAAAGGLRLARSGGPEAAPGGGAGPPATTAALAGTTTTTTTTTTTVATTTPTVETATATAAAPPAGRWEPWVVLAWCVGLAVLSLFIKRANPDDLYYINLSQWVTERGTFPLDDTIFANQRWPMTSWPPIASYDALVGEVARVLSVRAGTVAYELVPPLATAGAVLALWRLLRAWRAPYLAWTLTIALAFLLLDGAATYATPGNLFVTRLWQGKVILLCVVVPLALVHLLRYVERPDRRGLVWLTLTGIAAVACSTTAMFLLPVVALAGVAPLLRRPRAAIAGFVALAAYPVVACAVTVVLGGRSADDFGGRALYRFDPEWIGHAVFLTYVPAFVVVLGVLLGPLTVPNRAARLTTAVSLLAVGVVLVPGATHLAYDVTGLGPTLWRLTWACTIAALVGVGAVRAWILLRGRWSLKATALVAVAAAVGYGFAAPPTFSAATHTSFAPPLHWQRSDSSMASVRWMLRHVRGQGVVLGPNTVSITVSVMTNRLKPVAPRAYFMANLAKQPGFDFAQRLLLTRVANPPDSGAPRRNPQVVTAALNALDVKAACLGNDNVVGIGLLEVAGFRLGLRTEEYRCLVRRGVD